MLYADLEETTSIPASQMLFIHRLLPILFYLPQIYLHLQDLGDTILRCCILNITHAKSHLLLPQLT